MNKTYQAVLGRTGRDPEPFFWGSDKQNEAIKFSVAQRTGWGPEDTRWYDVAVFDEETVAKVKRELPKGSLVAVEGYVEEREYNDRIYYNLTADRVGLVQPFPYKVREPRKPQQQPVAAASVEGYEGL